MPSGLQFFEIVNRMGVHPVLIGKKSYEPDGPVRFSFQQIGKYQINYSNHQYHLLIGNKHYKLLT